MTDLRTAAQQALEALTSDPNAVVEVAEGRWELKSDLAITALCAALAEPTVKESLQVESAFAENATTQQQLEEAPPSDYRRGYWDGFEIGKREGRIEAENALAEPAQEPVAWLTPGQGLLLNNGEGFRFSDWTPLYTAPPQRPAEPVAYSVGRTLHWHEGKGVNDAQLYAAPPQRKPLTEEEIRDLWSWAMTAEAERTATTQQHAFARAIERAHKIGGEG